MPRRARATASGFVEELDRILDRVDAEAGEVGDRVGEIAAPLALEPIEVGLGGAGEGRSPGDHEMEEGAEGVEIGPAVDRRAGAGLLRGHVFRRAGDPTVGRRGSIGACRGAADGKRPDSRTITGSLPPCRPSR